MSTSTFKFFRVSKALSFGMLKDTTEYHLKFTGKFMIGYESNTSLQHIQTIKRFLRKTLGLEHVGSDWNSASKTEYVYFQIPDSEVSHVDKIFSLIDDFILKNMLFRVPKLLTLVSNRFKNDKSFLSTALTYYHYSMFLTGLNLDQALEETNKVLMVINTNSSK